MAMTLLRYSRGNLILTTRATCVLIEFYCQFDVASLTLFDGALDYCQINNVSRYIYRVIYKKYSSSFLHLRYSDNCQFVVLQFAEVQFVVVINLFRSLHREMILCCLECPKSDQ